MGEVLESAVTAGPVGPELQSLIEPVAQKAVGLARAMCDTPVAALWLMDGEQRWITTAGVMGEAEARHLDRLCAPAVMVRSPLVIEDVEGSPQSRGQRSEIRFYAGHAVRASDGRPLGVLCVAGPTPRDLDLLGLVALAALASGIAPHVEHAYQVRSLGPSAAANIDQAGAAVPAPTGSGVGIRAGAVRSRAANGVG